MMHEYLANMKVFSIDINRLSLDSSSTVEIYIRLLTVSRKASLIVDKIKIFSALSDSYHDGR